MTDDHSGSCISAASEDHGPEPQSCLVDYDPLGNPWSEGTAVGHRFDANSLTAESEGSSDCD